MQLVRIVLVLAAAAAVAGQYLQERYRLLGPARSCPGPRPATATRRAGSAASGP